MEVTSSNVAQVTAELAEALQLASTPCSADVQLVAGTLEKVAGAAHNLSDEALPQLASLLDGVLRASQPDPEDSKTVEDDARATSRILEVGITIQNLLLRSTVKIICSSF